MSYSFVSGADAKNDTTTASPTFGGFTVGAGEGVIIYLNAYNGTTISAVSDGTNTYAIIGSYRDTIDNWNHYFAYKPNAAAVAGGTLSVTKSVADPHALAQWWRYTGLDSAAAAEAGPSGNSIAGTTTTTDACATGAVTATSQPAMLFALGIDGQGNALTAGTGLTSRRAASATWIGSAFGWSSLAQDELITDLSSHTPTFTAANAGDTFYGLALMFKIAAAAGSGKRRAPMSGGLENMGGGMQMRGSRDIPAFLLRNWRQRGSSRLFLPF